MKMKNNIKPLLHVHVAGNQTQNSHETVDHFLHLLKPSHQPTSLFRSVIPLSKLDQNRLIGWFSENTYKPTKGFDQEGTKESPILSIYWTHRTNQRLLLRQSHVTVAPSFTSRRRQFFFSTVQHCELPHCHQYHHWTPVSKSNEERKAFLAGFLILSNASRLRFWVLIFHTHVMLLGFKSDWRFRLRFRVLF